MIILMFFEVLRNVLEVVEGGDFIGLKLLELGYEATQMIVKRLGFFLFYYRRYC